MNQRDPTNPFAPTETFQSPGAPPPPAPREMVFGRVRVVMQPDGDAVFTRAGMVGHGGSRIWRAWLPEQIADALGAAQRRRGEDAICERRALEWALAQMLRIHGGRP